MHFSDKANVAEKMARGKWNKTKIFTPSLHSCLLVAGDHLYSQMERGTVGIKRHICYHIGSNPDLKIRSPDEIRRSSQLRTLLKRVVVNRT